MRTGKPPLAAAPSRPPAPQELRRALQHQRAGHVVCVQAHAPVRQTLLRRERWLQRMQPELSTQQGLPFPSVCINNTDVATALVRAVAPAGTGQMRWLERAYCWSRLLTTCAIGCRRGGAGAAGRGSSACRAAWHQRCRKPPVPLSLLGDGQAHTAPLVRVRRRRLQLAYASLCSLMQGTIFAPGDPPASRTHTEQARGAAGSPA